MKIKIAPCILDCDLTRLADSVAEVEAAGADLLHVDVADGHFAPNLMAGPQLVKAIKRCAKVPVDVHLMVDDPARYAPVFIDAGADIVLFHAEAVEDPRPVMELIKSQGAQCGIALKPATSAAAIEGVAESLDAVLALTVEPGFSGQGFMESGSEKIPLLRKMCKSDIDIYIDGGIGPETAEIVVRRGANVLAAASAIFNADVPPGEALVRLRKVAEEAQRASSA